MEVGLLRSTFRTRLWRAGIDILIILSATLTFALEGGTVLGASWHFRSTISLLCLGLDIFFFLELAVRAALAFADGKLASYFRYGGGWRDSLAAILPLVFTSGPFLFGGIDGLADTATVVALGSFRLLRGLGLLRLLRLLRIFSEDWVLWRDSPQKNERRTGSSGPSRAAALALVSSLAVLILAELASIAGYWPDAHTALASKREASLRALAQTPGADGSELVALADDDLLLVRYQGRVVYTRYSTEEYHRRFGPDEIGYLRKGKELEVFFSLSSELKAQAASTLASGLSGLAILAALGWGGRRQRLGPERKRRGRRGTGDKLPAGTVPTFAAVGLGEPTGEAEFEGLLGTLPWEEQAENEDR